MADAPTQMAIDGKWVPCLPTEEFGGLGVRYTCELRDDVGQPAKRLLLRRRTLPTPADSAAQLAVSKAPEAGKAAVRPAMKKTYQEAPGRGEEVCRVVQQDVTGLTPLGRAALQALTDGSAARFWRMFYGACAALREFGAAVAAGTAVPLQCPPSLAVAADGSAVLLDAEIRVAGSLSQDSPVRRFFGVWFGPAGVNGFADARQASLMHSRAMLVYFVNLLRQAPPPPTAAAHAAQAEAAAKLAQAPPDVDLNALENWARNNADGAPPSAVSLPPAVPHAGARPESSARMPMPAPSTTINVQFPGQPAAAPPKKRSLFLRISLLLNLLLIAALVILLLWLKSASGNQDHDHETPEGDAPIAFSSYSVVFPQGNYNANVAKSLSGLFPDQKFEPKGYPDLLKNQLDTAAASLAPPDKLQRLLSDLERDRSIHFMGFDAANPTGGLKSIIAGGGVFAIAASSYGSLLQPNSVDRLLNEAGRGGQQEDHALLDGLQKAVKTYASAEDAVAFIGGRPAYLVMVGFDAAAHRAARKKLLERQDKPVFFARPVTELFDAVDSADDTGGGKQGFDYLKLDMPCYWRLAGVASRLNVDANNPSNGRMKWQRKNAEAEIKWKPIAVTRIGGKPENVNTFDIGIELQDKVVVFRNQTIWHDESEESVVRPARRYLEETLKFQVKAPSEVISVEHQGLEFAATLKYSNLASQATNANKGPDLDIYKDAAAFETERGLEDTVPYTTKQ